MLASQTNLAVEDRISWQNNNALTLASSGDLGRRRITAQGDNARLTMTSIMGAMQIDKNVTLTGKNAELALNSGGHYSQYPPTSSATTPS